MICKPEMDLFRKIMVLMFDFLIWRTNFSAQTKGDVGYQYSHEMYEDMLTDEAVGIEPSFDVPIANMTVIAGQTAVLPCSVNNLGDYKVAWVTDETVNTITYEDATWWDDKRFSVVRSYLREWHLEIRDVQQSDEGVYRCTVNTSPVTSKVVKLFVKVPAKIIDELSSDDVTAREGDTVVLICNVTGVPPPSVKWYRRPVLGMYPDEGESKECKPETGGPGIDKEAEMLIIQNISRYCDDVYECIASNGVQEASSRRIRVTVEYEPEVVITTERLGHTLGKQTVLECTIYGYPIETTKWIKNNQEIGDQYTMRHSLQIYKEGPSKYVLSLTISDLHPEDFGDYTCFAKNYIGTDEQIMTLFMEHVNVVNTIKVTEPQNKHTYQTEGTGTEVIQKHSRDKEVAPNELGLHSDASATVTTSTVCGLPVLSVILCTVWGMVVV